MKKKEYITTVKAEDHTVWNELAMNGYPTDFVDEAVKEWSRNMPTDDRTVGTAVIPYCRGVSKASRRVLASHQIRTIMRPRKLKWRLMRGAKDSLPSMEEPGVMYTVGCITCPEVYIGQTKQTAPTRIREHQSFISSGCLDLSGMSTHVLYTGHRMHWDPMIVAKESHEQRRKIRQVLFTDKIRGKKMNLDRGLTLSPLWLDLLREKN